MSESDLDERPAASPNPPDATQPDGTGPDGVPSRSGSTDLADAAPAEPSVTETLREFATPRWLRWIALALAFAVGAWFLGAWQWSSYQTRQARADRVSAHYDAAPVPVTDVLTGGPTSLEREWTHVTARGRYDAGSTLYVRNRPNGGDYGYEILVPLRLENGQSVLVDRGWVVNSAVDAATPPPIPAPPSGDVTVTGWVRLGEPSLGRALPADQLASINLAEAERSIGRPVLGGYLVLDAEQPPGPTSPGDLLPLEKPDTSTGPHMAYAIQWWGAMPAGLVFIWFAVRRELRAAAGAGRATPRPKKVRIWDEEDA